MLGRAALLGLASIALAPLGCSATAEEPVRIGILSDCYGPFSNVHEPIVASSELPLVARGGRLRGPNPSDGVEGATVAGRTVELVIGCVTGTQDVIPEARRLVEEEGADALVGPVYANHGPVLGTYARRRPDTLFVVQPSDAPELTLTDPSPNVFRFSNDSAQNAAGLGSYAYNTLGWRTATTVGDDTPYGWGNVAGFVAEFCALGGKVVDRMWVLPTDDPQQLLSRIERSVDGVYLGPAITPMSVFVRKFTSDDGDPATGLLANAVLLYDPQIVREARGLVAAGPLPPEPTNEVRAYAVRFEKAFPRIGAAAALDPLAIPYHDGVAAIVEALERTGGTTGSKLVAELAHVKLDSPVGHVRLDGNRQAIAPNYLSRVTSNATGGPRIRTARVIEDVEQTFGGYFRPGGAPPSRTSPVCRRHEPPRWARG